MKHPSAMTAPRVRANLTRCRKSLANAMSRLSSWQSEIDSLKAAGKPVPEWVGQRLRESETNVWFYRKRIGEYEAWLDSVGEPYAIVIP